MQTNRIERLRSEALNVSDKVRLEHAARMLVETNLPCSTVGYDCGFTTLSLFYKLFKDYFGMTPGKFHRKS